jgi:hypothetical protein
MALVLLMGLSGCGYEISYDSENRFEGESIDIASSGYGFIEGGLSYPSEEIPDDLRVCTENEKGSSCGIYKRLEDEEFQYGVGYKIEVPVGTYKVFSKTEETGYEPLIGGYTECGDKPECTDHSMVLVEVLEGETVEGVDLYDFQAEFY